MKVVLVILILLVPCLSFASDADIRIEVTSRGPSGIKSAIVHNGFKLCGGIEEKSIGGGSPYYLIIPAYGCKKLPHDQSFFHDLNEAAHVMCRLCQ